MSLEFKAEAPVILIGDWRDRAPPKLVAAIDVGLHADFFVDCNGTAKFGVRVASISGLEGRPQVGWVKLRPKLAGGHFAFLRTIHEA